ncbi:MAG: 4-hydroxy-tetrahydrodipicolinate synthase [Prolixibacteraceae bacterium]|jgi:4-hydroxy-tetrahydrodipicolinate synthase|nr:4-hydroxy-tetrahydrodipicolinate synthase [Prolixibacteraceae bacterium]
MNKVFHGAGVALITPFLSDLQIDYTSLGKLVDAQIENHMDYLVVLGTTAETATLSHAEKQSLIDFVIARTAGKIPVMVGVGGNSTSDVIDQLKTLNLQKADGILSVVPYYNKPSQEGIYQHFMAISAACPLPVVLYNVPGRTSTSMSAETTLRLAHDAINIVGTKEASGNFGEIIKILKGKPDKFSVITGDDSLIVPTTSLGGEGVISVAANLAPRLVSAMTHYALNGDYTNAAAIQLEMQSLVEDLFAEGNPPGVKAAMHSAGLCENIVRLPLVPVSEKLYKSLAEKTKKLI